MDGSDMTRIKFQVGENGTTVDSVPNLKSLFQNCQHIIWGKFSDAKFHTNQNQIFKIDFTKGLDLSHCTV